MELPWPIDRKKAIVLEQFALDAARATSDGLRLYLIGS
jgi:hypothetical protein